MRGLFIALAIILALILVGWITVSNTEDRAGIILEKETIQKDARELSHSTREFMRDADERVRRTVESDAGSTP